MAYPFAAADVLTAVDLNAMIGAPTQNTQTGTTYTAVLLDAGKTVTLNNASAVTLTIPAQATVAWAANTQLNFLNLGAGTVTITPAADVTINGTPLTLTTSKGGSLVRTASNTWTFIPFSAGGSNAPVINEGSSTNVTFSTLTNPDSDGKNYRLARFNVTGTLVVTTAGQVEALIAGAGASSGRATAAATGAGDGSIVFAGIIRLTPASMTVTVAVETTAPGSNAVGNNGVASVFAGITVRGGWGNGDPNYGPSSTGAGASARLGKSGVTSSISGSAVEYGKAGPNSYTAGDTPGTGGGADASAGNNRTSAGAAGVVMARWEI